MKSNRNRSEERRLQRQERRNSQIEQATILADKNSPNVISNEKGQIRLPGSMVKTVEERVPRLPCPNCGFVISLSLQDLITATGFTCAKCLTTLTIRRDESEDALKHVQTFYAAVKDLKLT